MSGDADSPPSGAAPSLGSSAAASGSKPPSFGTVPAAAVSGVAAERRRSPTAEAMGALDRVLSAADVPARWLADDHRGISLEAAGWPLDIGIAVAAGMLRAQAEVLGPGQVEPHELLHDHRKRPFARYSHADSGAVWVEAELPLLAATPDLIDAMLGALLELADQARRHARASRGN